MTIIFYLLFNKSSFDSRYNMLRRILGDRYMTRVKTGQVVTKSGQYRPVGCKTEVTLVEGKRVPPTSSGITKFVMVDPTKHKK